MRYVAHKQYHCKSCNKAFNNTSVLLKHSCVAENQNSLENEMNSGNSENHLEINSGKVSSLPTCQICRKQFPNLKYLNTHMKTHRQKEPLPCIHCKKQFKTNIGLVNHVKNTHDEKKQYNCDHCEKQYKEKYSLKRHVAKYHQEGKNLSEDKESGAKKKTAFLPHL